MTLSDSDDNAPFDKSYIRTKINRMIGKNDNLKNEIKNVTKEFDKKIEKYKYDQELLELTNQSLRHDRSGIKSKSRYDKYEARPIKIDCPPKRDQSPRGMSKDNSLMFLETIKNYITNEGEEKNEKVRDTQRDTLCKIFKNEYIQNLHNKSHAKSNLELKCPNFIKTGVFEYNSEKVYEKQRTCHRQITELGSMDFKDFINQFKYFDVSDFSEIEFNNLVRMCLNKEQIQIVNKSHINAMSHDTESYLTALSEVLVGGDKSVSDLERELSNHKDASNNIMGILAHYEYKLAEFPDSYMTHENAAQRTIHLVTNYLPTHLISVLKERNSDKINGVLSSYAFRNFLQIHKTEINAHLSKQSNKNIVKKVAHNNTNLSSDEESNVQSSFNGARKKTYKKHDTKKHEHIEVVQESHHAKDDKKESKNDQLTINNFENIISQEDCTSDFSDDENIFKVSSQNTKKCSTCMNNYHTPRECIFHPDKNIRNENLKRIKLKSCLLCRLRTHTTMDCPFFPNIGPTAPPCSNCEDNGFYQMHHPASDCLRSNFLAKFIEKSEET